MDRSQKADLVAELKNVFTETSVVVITRNLGLSVAQSTDLRLKMRDAGAQFKVAKNRLAKIALEGTKYGSIGEMLTGPTALATSVDPVAAAKVAVEFAKTNDRLDADQLWLAGRFLSFGDCIFNSAEIVAVFDDADFPSCSFETFRYIFGKSQ